MSRLKQEQREHLFAIRRIMDNVIKAIPKSNEAEFNASAAVINENAAAFYVWKPDADYVRGDVMIDPDDRRPYWAMHNHGASVGQVHQPSLSPTIWVHCHGTSPETAQEFISEGHNPYMAGHYCVENGVVAKCVADNTIHAPSVYPAAWEIVEA